MLRAGRRLAQSDLSVVAAGATSGHGGAGGGVVEDSTQPGHR